MSDFPPPPPPPPPPPRPEGFRPTPGFEPLPAQLNYADWWRRFVALIVDGLIVSVPMSIIVFGLLGFELFPSRGAQRMTTLAAFRPGTLIITAAQVAYYTFLNGSERGQTIGKQFLRIRVRDQDHDVSIGYGRAFARHVVISVAALACGLVTIVDGLWPLWDQRRQALHDKIARSVVVMAD